MCFYQLTEQQGKRLPFAVLDRLFTYENPLCRTGIAKKQLFAEFQFHSRSYRHFCEFLHEIE